MLGLLSRYPVMLSSLCKSFEDRAPVDSSTCVRYPSELQRLDNIERYQDGSPCNCWEGDVSSVLAKQLAGTMEKASDGGTFHHIDDTHCQKGCLLAATTMGREVIFVALNLLLIRYYDMKNAAAYWNVFNQCELPLSTFKSMGSVSLTFRELSKMISRKYTMPEITFMVRNFVLTHNFQFEILISSTISAIHSFWGNILESSRTLVKHSPGTLEINLD